MNAYLETKSQPVTAMFDYTYAELPLDLERQRAQALALDSAQELKRTTCRKSP